MNTTTNKCQCPGGKDCKKPSNHDGDRCRFNAKARVFIGDKRLPSCITCTYNKDKAKVPTAVPTQPNDSDYYANTLGMRGIYKLMQDFSNKTVDTAFCPKVHQGTIGIILQEDRYDQPLNIKELQLLVYFHQYKPWTSTTVTNNTIKVLLKLANYRLNIRSNMEPSQDEDDEPMNLQEESEGPVPTPQEVPQEEPADLQEEIQEIHQEIPQTVRQETPQESETESVESVEERPPKKSRKVAENNEKSQKQKSVPTKSKSKRTQKVANKPKNNIR